MPSAPIQFMRDEEELSAVLLRLKPGAARTAGAGAR